MRPAAISCCGVGSATYTACSHTGHDVACRILSVGQGSRNRNASSRRNPLRPGRRRCKHAACTGGIHHASSRRLSLRRGGQRKNAASTLRPAAASRCGGENDARTPLAPAASTMRPATASRCGVEDYARTLLAPASMMQPVISNLCWVRGPRDRNASSGSISPRGRHCEDAACIGSDHDATCRILSLQDTGSQDATCTGTGSIQIASACWVWLFGNARHHCVMLHITDTRRLTSCCIQTAHVNQSYQFNLWKLKSVKQLQCPRPLTNLLAFTDNCTGCSSCNQHLRKRYSASGHLKAPYPAA